MEFSPPSPEAPEPFEDFAGALTGLHRAKGQVLEEDRTHCQAQQHGLPSAPDDSSAGLATVALAQEQEQEQQHQHQREEDPSGSSSSKASLSDQASNRTQVKGTAGASGSSAESSQSSSRAHTDRRLNSWISRLHGEADQEIKAVPSEPEQEQKQQGGLNAAESDEARRKREQEEARERRAEEVTRSLQRTQEARRCRDRAAARELERERIRRREKEILALEARLSAIRKRERERVQSELALWDKERRIYESKVCAQRQKVRQTRREAEHETLVERESVGLNARLSVARVKHRERLIEQERQRDKARAALGFEARSSWERAIDRERQRIFGVQRDKELRSWEARRSVQREIERTRRREEERLEQRTRHSYAWEARSAGVRKIEWERQVGREWEIERQRLALEAREALERERDRVNSGLESWNTNYASWEGVTGAHAADVKNNTDDAGSEVFDLGNLDSDSDTSLATFAGHGSPASQIEVRKIEEDAKSLPSKLEPASSPARSVALELEPASVTRSDSVALELDPISVTRTAARELQPDSVSVAELETYKFQERVEHIDSAQLEDTSQTSSALRQDAGINESQESPTKPAQWGADIDEVTAAAQEETLLATLQGSEVPGDTDSVTTSTPRSEPEEAGAEEADQGTVTAQGKRIIEVSSTKEHLETYYYNDKYYDDEIEEGGVSFDDDAVGEGSRKHSRVDERVYPPPYRLL